MSEHQVYMSAKNGPFRCSHCEYFSLPRNCSQKDIIALLGANRLGFADVDPGGCSDYYEPLKSRSIAERMRG